MCLVFGLSKNGEEQGGKGGYRGNNREEFQQRETGLTR
jgi:hypothetical protein